MGVRVRVTVRLATPRSNPERPAAPLCKEGRLERAGQVEPARQPRRSRKPGRAQLGHRTLERAQLAPPTQQQPAVCSLAHLELVDGVALVGSCVHGGAQDRDADRAGLSHALLLEFHHRRLENAAQLHKDRAVAAHTDQASEVSRGWLDSPARKVQQHRQGAPQRACHGVFRASRRLLLRHRPWSVWRGPEQERPDPADVEPDSDGFSD